MKTQLTEQELIFYNALLENKEKHEKNNSNDYYLNILCKAVPIKDKSYKEIDFAFDLKAKKNL